MKTYSNPDIFQQDGVKKVWHFKIDGKEYTRKEYKEESVRLVNNLCTSARLTFGLCESSEIEVCLWDPNVATFKDKTMEVWMTVGTDTNTKITLGTFKITEDEIAVDRSFHSLKGSDMLAEIREKDVSSWYNSLIGTDGKFSMTLLAFRNSFFTAMGITQETVSLPQDTITVTNVLNVTRNETTSKWEISGLTGENVMQAICQINGCFGNMTGDNKFRYVFLQEPKEGLYPSETLYPAEDLYPEDREVEIGLNRTNYEWDSVNYGTKRIEKIKKLVLVDSSAQDNDLTQVYYGSGEQNETYTIKDNWLLYGREVADLQAICNRLFPIVSKVTYWTFSCNAMGNPLVEVGDRILVGGRKDVFTSYVLSRELTGCNRLRASYKADGEEKWTDSGGIVGSITALESGVTRLKKIIADEVIADIVVVKSHLTAAEANITELTSTVANIDTVLTGKITIASNTANNAASAASSAASVAAAAKAQAAEALETANAVSILLPGYALIANLANGTTTINGGCITTGTVNANRIDCKGVLESSKVSTAKLDVGSVFASSTVKGGNITLNGNSITGVTYINGHTFTELNVYDNKTSTYKTIYALT